ncbi:peroxiredoxin [Mycetocola tolaasinivorans]|uniref:Peroxiredoxin n=1 Tax=Mycetocola tolaasinivorans TaxID=76635 RepID=A0A3L7AB67_9MICO|nr:peroxiredoxin [Mycetocola tolaasinivorans]RLP76911.1 peroxiredoxin [Mycetocola tolaasinivorans]
MRKIDSPAPDFELPNQYGEQIRLSDFRDRRPVVLVFVPLAFSGICTGELDALRDNAADFAAHDAEVLIVTVDSKWALRTWGDNAGYAFSLLSDFWPHGDVAAAYGVFDQSRGVAERATFVIGIDGVIRDAFMTAAGEPRAIERYREALSLL